ncbi:MAG: OmpA family protein [Bacteroidales bacterium]
MNYNSTCFTFLLVFFITCNTGMVFPQSGNLVQNSGFETYVQCPRTHIQFDHTREIVKNWIYPTHATPDYFNRCSSGDAGVPKNFAGVAEPKSGDGYVGAILTGTESEYREYFGAMLTRSLERDKKYCVYFSYRLASYSKLAVDQLSLRFYNDKVESDIKTALGGIAEINNQPGLFLDNMEKWREICTVYTARGDERFFVIGNFRPYESTNYVVTDKNMVNLRDKAYAYYYFDDVAILPLDNCDDCPCVNKDMEVFLLDTFYTGGMNPYTGRIEKIINDGRIKIAVNGGTPPYRVNWSNGSNALQLRNLPAGTYTYTVKDENNCTKTGSITFIEPEITKDEFVEGLNNIEEGSSIILENIFFAFNKTELLPESYPELDKVSQFMIENNIAKIEISGHTDDKGSDDYNQKLSEGRAQAVVDYLLTKGVNPSSLEAIGYGESKPIDTNKTEEGRANNRRVEFKLIKK